MSSKNFGAKGAKIGSLFCDFLKFGSLIFFEISYCGSLQQFVTSSKGKTHEKSFRDHIWVKMGQKFDQN